MIDGSPSYRGPDRRRAPAEDRDPPLVARCVVGMQLLLVATHLLGSWSATPTPTATSWLTPSVAVVSALAAAIFAVRWRLTGDATALWTGSALLVYAGANIAFPELLRPLTEPGESVAPLVLRPVSVIVVMLLLLVAVRSPGVDTRLRIGRVVRFGAGAAGVAGVVATISPGLGLLFGPPLDQLPPNVAAALGQVAVAALWLALGIGFLLRTKPRWRGVEPWLALMLLGLAEARLALALSVGGEAAWILTSQMARLLALLAALIGAVRQLERSYVRQRATLLSTDARLSSLRATRDAEIASGEERAHDLRSALVGIGSAAAVLERNHASLSEIERVSLARAVSAEISRLQQIVAGVRASDQPFDLAEALAPVIACARAQGSAVTVGIPAGLLVTGRRAEIAELVQNLLDNAGRHAAGTAVEITATPGADGVVIHVDDRGPGIDPRVRDRIFERGAHGGADGSSGLGLYVAARIVRSHGGELAVTDRVGGGTRFSFSLPDHRSHMEVS